MPWIVCLWHISVGKVSVAVWSLKGAGLDAFAANHMYSRGLDLIPPERPQCDGRLKVGTTHAARAGYSGP